MINASTLISQDGNKFKVTDPREGGKIAGTYEAKAVLEAMALAEKITGEINLAALALQGGRIELLSVDGAPVNGIATSKADPARKVYSTKANPEKGKLARDVFEPELCKIAGYVLCRRNGSGNVMSEFVPGPDFNRYTPISANGIAQLAGLLVVKA